MLRLRQFIPVLWLPGLMYLGYAVARLNGIQGKTDLVGISSVMRIVFLSFGCSTAYLMTLAAQWEPFRSRLQTPLWHNLAGWSLAMIIDDSFMIHEKIGFYLKIKDSIPMLMLGVWLLIILGIYRERFIKDFWKCFTVFIILSWIAVFGDVVTGREGTIMVGTFEFDYEMVCEGLAVVALVAGLGLQAIHELRSACAPDSAPPDVPNQHGAAP